MTQYCEPCGSSSHDESSHHQKHSEYCENQRPKREVFCQKLLGHKGSCRAVVFWEEVK